MNNTNKKIGIWGYGAVGRSAIDFFLAQSCSSLAVCDKLIENQELKKLADMHNIRLYDQQSQLNDFLMHCDFILASPGIDLRNFKEYGGKWICEVDLFAQHWQKPVIAITGTLGKTSVTHLLAQQLELYGKKVAVGGNIGTPMLSLIPDQNNYDLAVLELSSFQLEYAKQFAPDLAIITNVYPNHLDRHTNFGNYLSIKKNIFRYQNPQQKKVLPINLYNDIEYSPTTSFFSLVSHAMPISYYTYFFNEQQQIVRQKQGKSTELISSQAPAHSFKENWLIVAAALNQFGLKLFCAPPPIALPHRLEKVAAINEITFYNDSKSTVIESTLAAISALDKQPIILLLGGISKGVNRIPQLENLPQHVKHVVCFGAEAHDLHAACLKNNLPSSKANDLIEALKQALQQAQSGESVLLSPGGASYDLYRNYEERGSHFKSLVGAFAEHQKIGQTKQCNNFFT